MGRLDVRARPGADAQKKTLVASEQSRPDVARRRDQWLKYQSRIDPARLVFIDETWVKTNMAPLRGWAPCGARLKASAPFGHWNTTTFLAALRSDRIEAPWLLDGPINGARFLVYVLSASEAATISFFHSGSGQIKQPTRSPARAKFFEKP